MAGTFNGMTPSADREAGHAGVAAGIASAPDAVGGGSTTRSRGD
jgi:hypothetical protein